MEQGAKAAIAASIEHFKLPEYEAIPDVGLYLEQTVRYVSEYLSPLPGITLTGSMVSNYVKKDLIESPVKKLYRREHLAYLFFIAVAKSVLTLEDIQLLIAMQKQTYDTKRAYEYFAEELLNVLQLIFGLKDRLDTIGERNSDEKIMLRNTIITIAHKIYLEKYFAAMRESYGSEA